jgi:hypothetical protein
MEEGFNTLERLAKEESCITEEYVSRLQEVVHGIQNYPFFDTSDAIALVILAYSERKDESGNCVSVQLGYLEIFKPEGCNECYLLTDQIQDDVDSILKSLLNLPYDRIEFVFESE